MENHDKTGSEVHGLIQVEKHTGDDAVDCMKKAIKERAVMQEKVPELRVNRKDTMAMDDIDEFERHRSSTLHGIFIAAGRAEAAMAKEGSPQWIILSIFSISDFLGWRVYIISS